MRIKVTDYIEPIYTTYYTMMGRYADQTTWYHIATSDIKEDVVKMKASFSYNYFKLIEFDLETYDDENLYKTYHRQQKFKKIISD